jgi:hypothetical protein
LKDNLRYRIHCFLSPAGAHFYEPTRGLSAYQKDIKEKIKNSTKIYFLLVSGQTMLYDPKEQFIYDTLLKLPFEELKKKDIRIKLLDTKTKAFTERAQWLIEEMKKNKDLWAIGSVDEYLMRCYHIAKQLKDITPHVTHYKEEPLWRLCIFDDSMYLSTYVDSEGTRCQGQLSCVSYVPSRSATYQGLLSYFIRLS